MVELTSHQLRRPSELDPSPLLFAQQLPPGRLIELCGSRGCARLTTAASVIRCAQIEGETTAWIQKVGGALYPPDLSDCGVDLQALAVLHIPRSAGSYGLLRAAELLLRSGAFGVVVIDLQQALVRSSAWQGRLLSLAREHQSRVILITSASGQASASLGPLVSLRVEPRRVRRGRGAFAIEYHILKNKQGLPLALPAEPRRGPWGLK